MTQRRTKDGVPQVWVETTQRWEIDQTIIETNHIVGNSFAGDYVGGDKIAGDKVAGDRLDTRGSQGFIHRATGNVTQIFGNQRAINTGGDSYTEVSALRVNVTLPEHPVNKVVNGCIAEAEEERLSVTVSMDALLIKISDAPLFEKVSLMTEYQKLEERVSQIDMAIASFRAMLR